MPDDTHIAFILLQVSGQHIIDGIIQFGTKIRTTTGTLSASSLSQAGITLHRSDETGSVKNSLSVAETSYKY